MNCFYCKGDMVPDFTTHVAELENCIVIIKHVPCLKCSQCGEVVYTGTTLQKNRTDSGEVQGSHDRSRHCGISTGGITQKNRPTAATVKRQEEKLLR